MCAGPLERNLYGVAGSTHHVDTPCGRRDEGVSTLVHTLAVDGKQLDGRVEQGTVMFLSAVQFWKAYLSTEVRDAGRLSVVMLLQPLKAYDPMEVMALQADKSTLEILVHSEKADAPMEVSLVHPERLRLFMPLHLLKASSAIVVSSGHSERLRPGKLLQFMKA